MSVGFRRELVSLHVRKSNRSLGFWISRRGFRIFCQWNLDSDSGFQSLVEFRLPPAVCRIRKPRIPHSKSKHFPWIRIPQANISWIPESWPISTLSGELHAVFADLCNNFCRYLEGKNPVNEVAVAVQVQSRVVRVPCPPPPWLWGLNPKRSHVQKRLTGEQTTQLNLVKNGLLAFKMILFRWFCFPTGVSCCFNWTRCVCPMLACGARWLFSWKEPIKNLGCLCWKRRQDFL